MALQDTGGDGTAHRNGGQGGNGADFAAERAALCRDLVALQIARGNPSLRTIAGHSSGAIGYTTVSKVLTGTTLLTQEQLLAVVRVLLSLDHDGRLTGGKLVRLDDPTLTPWRTRWQTLAHLHRHTRTAPPAPPAPEENGAPSTPQDEPSAAGEPAGAPHSAAGPPAHAALQAVPRPTATARPGMEPAPEAESVLLTARKEADSIREVAAARAEQLIADAQAERDQAAAELARLRGKVAEELAAAKDEAQRERQRASQDAARIREQAQQPATEAGHTTPSDNAESSARGSDNVMEGRPGTGAAASPGFGNFSDIMDAFFGQKSAPRSRSRPGEDALVRLDIELGDVAFGTSRDIQVDAAMVCDTCDGVGAAPGTSAQICDICSGRGEVEQVTRSFVGQVKTARPCPQCQGFGTVVPTPCPQCVGHGTTPSRRTLTVFVPPGIEDGTRIKLAGEGGAGLGGDPPGDLYVEIHEIAHPLFQRRDDDLHCTVTIPMTAAVLGTRIPLETLDGHKEMDVPPGTQFGQVILMPGLGITRASDGSRGDILVHTEIPVPTDLDPGQVQLIRQLAKRRGEEQPEQQGFFSRLKDAFNGY